MASNIPGFVQTMTNIPTRLWELTLASQLLILGALAFAFYFANAAMKNYRLVSTNTW